MTTRVTLLYVDGCPNWRETERRLLALQETHDLVVERRRVTTAEEAEHLGFRGSPTVLVEGVDPFASGAEPVGLACRLHRDDHGTLAGSPTRAQLARALTRSAARS